MNLKFVVLAQGLLCILGVPVFSQTDSLQELSRRLESRQEVMIYTAKEIITLDASKPSVPAVAVVDDHILATGTVDELKAISKEHLVTVDDRFSNHVIVPGFIAQHDHPMLAAVTMTTQIIAIEDWVMPSKTFPAAKDRADYLQRLNAANSEMTKPGEPLVSWGYHHYFHGELKKADLDAISLDRPIIVWHRSAHEFFLNSAAEKIYGVTREWYDQLKDTEKKQSDFSNAHYWEQGAFALMPLISRAIATPEKVKAGLEFVEQYFHANGVTLGCEPGGLASKKMQATQNAVLSDSATPFRWYYIVDGKSITGIHPDEKVISESEAMMTWGESMTAFLPKQVKLFADGAIFSQLMKVKDGYKDGHKGEWMMDLDFFARTFRVYWDAGYQLHIHVNGDEGLDMVLNQLELNMQRNPRADHRTVIVHFAVSRPDQVAKIKELGAIVSGNTYYPVALADNYRENGLDPARADSMVRMGDVEKAGISFSFHSDMPMAPGQPLLLMWSAVNRITNNGNVRAPEQRVSRMGALRAVTLDAAYSLQLEKSVGSIEPGKLANFTVLNDNPVTCEATRIKDIKIWGTIHEGRVLQVTSGNETAQFVPDSTDLELSKIRRLNAIYEQSLQGSDRSIATVFANETDKNAKERYLQRACSPGCSCGILHTLFTENIQELLSP
jgi:predicted amidohydrolase YtcJ